MRVRMRTTLAGPNGCAWPGDVVEVTEKEAVLLVRGGYAEAMEQPAQAETEPAEETKAPTKSRKRGRGTWACD